MEQGGCVRKLFKWERCEDASQLLFRGSDQVGQDCDVKPILALLVNQNKGPKVSVVLATYSRNKWYWSWRDGSPAKSTCFSCRGPWFSSENSCVSSQLPGTAGPGDQIFSSGIHRQKVVHIHIFRKTLICKEKCKNIIKTKDISIILKWSSGLAGAHECIGVLYCALWGRHISKLHAILFIAFIKPFLALVGVGEKLINSTSFWSKNPCNLFEYLFIWPNP